ncbi:MAG: 4-(cytidine 5'-diphospho)-2-C-methyl-D-erythritol kinase [Clostridia bacterium]|nr:4-(cytidine 5'-diphospho)-2-C-methyl-D-erythritol kinase [Clostridia bacterium]
MQAVKLKAHAKINLYLKVTGKRPNGYHDLVTVMQSISLHDTLTVKRASGEGIFLDTGGALPTDDSNLICKAAQAFFHRSGHPFGVTVTLEKKIPMQAGMGGGSADAAAMLRALNLLDDERFSLEELCAIGAEIGADVPFCIVGGTKLCRGIGERMDPLVNNLSGTLVVAIGPEGVSTPKAFAALDEMYDNFKVDRDGQIPLALMAAMESGEGVAAASHFENMFEQVIEPIRPAVKELKKVMMKKGAIAAMMSGSGPSVWGLFVKKSDAEDACCTLQSRGARAFVCEMIKEI